RLAQDAEPAERIDAVVVVQHPGRDARPAHAMEAVAAGDELAFDPLGLAVVPEADGRRAAVEIMDAGVLDLEQDRAAVGEPLRDHVGDGLPLVVAESPLAE